VPSIIVWDQNETVEEILEGYWSGSMHDERYYYSVPRGVSSRSTPTSSDGHHPTWYSREEVHTVKESPYKVRTRYSNSNGELVEDSLRTQYMSVRVSAPHTWGWPPGWEGQTSNIEARSITKARERLRDQESFNIGVAIAEAKKTAEMLASVSSRLASATEQARQWWSRKSGRARKAALATSGAWLEGYYGWGSLARDAFALDARLRRQLNEPLLISSSFVSRHTDEFQEGGPWNGKSKWEVLAKVGYTARIEDEFARQLDGWGLLNPLEVAWELVPFSFCVDWLIPIGNTLSSITATAGLRFHHGYMTTRHTFDYQRRYTSPYSGEVVEDAGLLHTTMKRMDRRVLSGFLPPQLYAEENPFRGPRIINAIALLTQTILGRRS